MNYKFKSSIIPYNRRLVNSFKIIFGIGLSKSAYLVNSFGFNYKFDVNLLNRYFFDCMAIVMKSNYILEDRLKFLIKSRFSHMREAYVIKFIRYSSGLPINGQRTHTNGRTPKNSFKFI